MRHFLLRAARWITASAVLLAALAFPSRAQHLGDVSLSTVSTTLATNLNCTGGSQLFTTGVTAGFSNLGQTQHVVSIVGTGGAIQTLQAEIDGIDNSGNVYRISEQLRLPAFFTSASLVGYGYFPRIQIQITCSPGTATFTMTYAGSASGPIPSTGSYQTAQLNKIIFSNTSAGTSQSDTIQTPFGSSAGMLLFNVNTTIPAGSTISVQCQGADVTGFQNSWTFTPVTNSGLNVYPIPGMPCPFMRIFYTAGGASAQLITVQFYFAPQGTIAGFTFQYGSQQLGVQALTEPAAGTSALSTIVDTRGVKQATLASNCTAGNYSINVQEYSSDPVLATTKLVTPVTAIPAATQAEVYIGSESNPAVDAGTLAVAPAGVLHFPQRALAFSFTNAGGAGTCTAQLYLTY